MESIPFEINPEFKREKRSYEIQYYFMGCTQADFRWQTCIGPDCSTSYDVDSGEFWHAM
jgi:hypothetical protein